MNHTAFIENANQSLAETIKLCNQNLRLISFGRKSNSHQKLSSKFVWVKYYSTAFLGKFVTHFF